MAQLIELKLVNEAGTPVAWPGTTGLVQVNLVDDLEAVWIGVSEDGLTNQIYPLSTPIATILGSWARVYQGIQAVVNGQTNVYNMGLEDYERRVAACCIAPQSEESPSPGTPPDEPDAFMLLNIEDDNHTFEMRQQFQEPAQVFINWGDGSPIEQVDFEAFTLNPITHEYAVAGEYEVAMRYVVPSPDVMQLFDVMDALVVAGLRFGPNAAAKLGGFGSVLLINNQITDANLQLIGGPVIPFLYLDDNQLTAASFPQFGPFTGILSLSRNPLGANVDFAPLDTGIGVLTASDCDMVTADFSGWAGQPSNVDLSSNQLTELNLDLTTLEQLRVDQNNLTSEAVDDILIALDANGLTGGTVDLSLQTPAAPPTVTGDAAKTSLEGKGWNVTVDS